MPKGIQGFQKGQKFSAEHIKKLSESHKGIKLSESTKKKISEFHKGKKKSPFSEEHKKHLSESHKGCIPWIKGKTKEEFPQIARPENGSKIGHLVSEETKVKISLKNRGEGNGKWTGGIRPTCGYIKIYSPNHPSKDASGYVFEHRLVVEKFIGRYLTKEECIHHINCIRNDNRIENLWVFPNAKEHAKWHIKLKKYPYLTCPMKREMENRWKNLIMKDLTI